MAWIIGVTGKGWAVREGRVKTVGRLRRSAFEIDIGAVVKGGETFNLVDQFFEVLHDLYKGGQVGGFRQGQIDSMEDPFGAFRGSFNGLVQNYCPPCMVCTKLFRAASLSYSY